MRSWVVLQASGRGSSGNSLKIPGLWKMEHEKEEPSLYLARGSGPAAKLLRVGG